LTRIEGPFLVDAHVHLHECFDPGAFFRSAAANVRCCAIREGLDGGVTGVLLLSESAGADRFEELAEGHGPPAAGWRLDGSPDPGALVLSSDGARLLVIAGRQIATKGGLEVLSLASRRRFPDGRPFRATVEAVQEAEAIPVIPWGFGKWWLGRERLVREAVRAAAPGELYLGDNGGRPERAREPALFRHARERGLGVLPGSDPLPFRSHESRAGSYGFMLEADFLERPAAELRERLRSGLQPSTYGARTSVPSFVASQLRMQLHKRIGRDRREGSPRASSAQRSGGSQ
jgi:hypothetical protein